MKTCSNCKRELPHESFYKDNTKKSGLSSECKDCRRAKSAARYQADKVAWGEQTKEWRRRNPVKYKGIQLRSEWRRQYGLTPCQVARQRIHQMDMCAVCDRPMGDDWVIDHCHDSSNVRGILCRNCNFLLGHSYDDIATLQSAVTYLERGGVWATSTQK